MGIWFPIILKEQEKELSKQKHEEEEEETLGRESESITVGFEQETLGALDEYMEDFEPMENRTDIIRAAVENYLEEKDLL